VPQSSLEIVDWYRHRAGNVTRGVLAGRPSVEDDDTLRTSSFQKLVHLNGLGV
jgi:hypothetical protein